MRFRRLGSLFVAVVMAVPVALFSIVLTPAAATAAPCTQTTDWSVPFGPRLLRMRCVNGAMVPVREKIKVNDACLGSVPPDAEAYVYPPKYCGHSGIGAEYIAQARAVMKLGIMKGGHRPLEVNPLVQWEVVTLGSKRADIVYVEPGTLENYTHVVEVKLWNNAEYKDQSWATKLTRDYITPLRTAGAKNVRAGTVYQDIGYVDKFRVADSKHQGKCTKSGYVVRTFNVTAPAPGLLLATENMNEDKPRCLGEADGAMDGFEEASGLEDEDFDPLGLAERAFGFVYGDPHLVTVDGLHYDLQSVGEFTLAQSEAYDLEVQARFRHTGIANISVIEDVAARIGEHVVQVGTDGLFIDGVQRTMATNEVVDVGGRGGVIYRGGVYYVLWDGQNGPVLRWAGRGQVTYYHPQTTDSDLEGVLGNANGNPRDDLFLRDRTPLPANAASNLIHDIYADSWRITDAISLFTYPAGKGTADYTDLTFPGNLVTLHDLSPQLLALGSAYCEQLQVPAGPQFNSCILDRALAANENFAAMAQQVKNVALDPQAPVVDANGRLQISFEGDTLPQSILPTTLTEDAATTAFAGSFTGTGKYRFFTQALPPHVAGRVSFDLLALGNWNSDSDTEKILVSVGRGAAQELVPATATPTGSGTLQSGVAFTKYRFELPLTHTGDQIEILFSATGVDGLSQQAFGIDNIDLSVTVVAPQTFNVTLPASVSDGVPAAGAGRMETAASRDVYRFTLAQPASVFFDITTCNHADSSTRGLYLRKDGVDILTDDYACYDKRWNNLAPGAYEIVIASRGGGTGTYGFNLFLVPPPQTFDVSIPTTVGNGVPAAGAGNIETLASQDTYRFTLTQPASIFFDITTCNHADSSTKGLYLRKDGVDILTDGYMCYDKRWNDLTPGAYEIVIAARGGTGTYGFNLFLVPPTQTFNIAIPATVSNGSPAAGAGNLETLASQDQYRFTLTEKTAVYIDMTACSADGSTKGFSLRRDGVDIVSDGYVCYDRQISLLPGSYEVVFAARGYTGQYAFNIFAVPDAQVFDVTIPSTVGNGVPAAGAGNIETLASQDRYRFTLTQPTSVFFDILACNHADSSTKGFYLRKDGVDIITDGYVCYDKRWNDLTPGTYEIVIAARGGTGTYGFNLFAVPAPQTFDITLPTTVGNGVPAAGAGNIETLASQDTYRFTLTQPTSIFFDITTCNHADSSTKGLYLKRDGVDIITDGYVCYDKRWDNLAAGTYEIVIAARGSTGTYGFNLITVPPPQTFNITIPTTVSNGVPAAGAGNIETLASQDTYRFTLTQPASIFFDITTCNHADSSTKGLYLRKDGVDIITDGYVCYDKRWNDLTPGTYEIVIAARGGTGTYGFNLFAVPAPQTFDITIPTTVSNGVPAAGAGNIETLASQDTYRFTLNQPTSVFFDITTCNHADSSTKGFYLRKDGADIITDGYVCYDKRWNNLAAGNYEIVIASRSGTGTYGFNLFAVPPPQTFDITIPATVSNGVPAAGAGNIETLASQDTYRFTVTESTAVVLDMTGCGIGNNSTKGFYLRRDGVDIISDGYYCTDRQLTLEPGVYDVVFTAQGVTGTYAFTLRKA